MARIKRGRRQNQVGIAGATKQSKKDRRTEFHQIFLTNKTNPNKGQVTIDLNYMFMKAKQVINPLKKLLMINRKAKEVFIPLNLMQTSATLVTTKDKTT
jgi:hypothetical protein